MLYWPATKAERTLAVPPPAEFAGQLRQAGVSPPAAGRVIVASWEPNEAQVLAAIREMGLELQIIFNKRAVIVLPAGVNKQSGLRAALAELEVSPRNVVAFGDAENDFAFLNLCGMPVAVANALPRLKDVAALVAQGKRGEDMAKLVDRWLASDLADVDKTNPRQQVGLGRKRRGCRADLKRSICRSRRRVGWCKFLRRRRKAAFLSRRLWTRMSSTRPSWSTARQSQCFWPAIVSTTSSIR